jgi:hypothetical protein
MSASSVRIVMILGCIGTLNLGTEASASTTPDKSSSAEPPREGAGEQPPWIGELIGKVEALRGLKAKRPIDIRVVARGPFLEALHATVSTSHDSRNQRELAGWLAFGFAEGDMAAGQVLREVRDETIAGFYDSDSKVLWVQQGSKAKSPLSQIGAADWTRVVLAHEITHALQDQWFDLSEKLEKATTRDQAEAIRSLVEGDAMVVSYLYEAEQTHKPASEFLAEIAAAVAVLPPEVLLRASGNSEKILSAPAIMRRELLFPYGEGFAFVEQLYRSGGFSLIDKAFASPPVSTAQILHPADYLAGRFPATVDAPIVPTGQEKIMSSSLGALGMEVLLLKMLPELKAKAMASACLGDAYTISQAPDHELALQWVTTWENESRAADFDQVLSGVVAQWPAVIGTGGWLPAAAWTKRFGDRVVLVRGIAKAQVAAALAAMPALVHAPPPPRPPLGDVKLVEGPTMSSDAQMVGGRYGSPSLGVYGKLPDGFTGAEGGKGGGLSIHGKPGQPLAAAHLNLLPQRPSSEQRLAVYTLMANMTAYALHFPALGEGSQEEIVDVGWAKGFAKDWVIPNGPKLRIVLLPACSEQATYALSEIWMTDAGRNGIDAWVKSLDVSEASKASACRIPGRPGLVAAAIPSAGQSVAGRSSESPGVASASEGEHPEGFLSKDVIKQIVHQHRSEVRSCYEAQLQGNPTLQGKIVVVFTIGGSGEVLDASVKETTISDQQVESCVTGVVRLWKFPEPTGHGLVKVSYPFVFRPREGVSPSLTAGY